MLNDLGAVIPLADVAFDVDAEHKASGGRTIGLLLLAGFVLSFVVTRLNTRMMRDPRFPWWPGSFETTGGLHIHHLVFGIFLVLITGFLGFALHPDSPWTEVLAVLFGVGAALTLDEYALWLHLEDVYWAEEGRRSVDAVILASLFAGLLILLRPLDVGGEPLTAALIVVGVVVSASVIAALKGKLVTAVVGLFVFPVAYAGAIRLAKPNSPWARWFYSPEKLTRATERHSRIAQRTLRMRDAIGGAPDT